MGFHTIWINSMFWSKWKHKTDMMYKTTLVPCSYAPPPSLHAQPSLPCSLDEGPEASQVAHEEQEVPQEVPPCCSCEVHEESSLQASLRGPPPLHAQQEVQGSLAQAPCCSPQASRSSSCRSPQASCSPCRGPPPLHAQQEVQGSLL